MARRRSLLSLSPSSNKTLAGVIPSWKLLLSLPGQFNAHGYTYLQGSLGNVVHPCVQEKKEVHLGNSELISGTDIMGIKVTCKAFSSVPDT